MADAMFELPERPFRGFIFDCDGTLADSMPLHFEAWKQALCANGARFELSWSAFLSRGGMSLEQTVVELNVEHRETLDPARVASDQRANFDRLLHRLTPVAPVADYARRISRDHPVSVASGNTLASVRRTLGSIGLLELFDIIVTPEQVRRGKPAPDMFLLAAERMGIAPAECVVFEDSTLGMQAAATAGMTAVFVRSADPNRYAQQK
jgi:beta-phosphoglucomutase-like phosphatase (HAD superfamily)